MNLHDRTPPQIDRLLTYREAARLLGITDRTVWSLVHDGALPVVRFGRNVRIDPVDLREFIERGKRGEIGGGR